MEQQSQKEVKDWACVDCDDTLKTHLGNYASDTQCRGCQTPKGMCQHMSMETRWWHIQNGTLKSRVESKLEREQRLKDNSDGNNKMINIEMLETKPQIRSQLPKPKRLSQQNT